MRTCLLIFLFALNAVQVIASEPSKVEHDIKVIKDLKLNNNEKNISSFTPTTSSINITDLKTLDEKLNSSESRKKRQVQNYYNQNMMDEMSLNDEMTMNDANVDAKSTVESINLPKSKGTSSFSIHANTVYILYPSIFQDPNIFGRLSIPQNIKMDQENQNPLNKQVQSPALTNIAASRLNNSGRFKRNIPIIPSKNGENPQRGDQDERNTNVETNLKGTIVVLNQDVIEQNTKQSY